MVSLTTIVAVIKSGEVLLTERKDFKVWCLPGGTVENGETLAEAAIREIQEETGLHVQRTKLVGIYSRPHWLEGGDHITLFTAKPISGKLQLQQTEVVDARYFSPDELPQNLLWWNRLCLVDALNGIGGSIARSLNVILPFEPGTTWQQFYEMRDRGELPPNFVEVLCDQPVIDAQKIEVGSEYS